jgi:hypothetical protein
VIDLGVQVALLEGKRPPQNQEEFKWLDYMGGPKGPRNKWPVEMKRCDQCKSEFPVTGFPSPTGKWLFMSNRCKECRNKPAGAKR